MTNPFGSSPSSGGQSWGTPGQSLFSSGPVPSSGASGGPASDVAGSSPAAPPVRFSTDSPDLGPGQDPAGQIVPVLPASGPKGILWTAVVTAVAGLVLGGAAFLSGSATDRIFLILAATGWVLAGIVTFFVLGVYMRKDTERRAESFYVADPAQSRIRQMALATALVGVLVTAVEIALWISKTVGA